MGGLGQFNYAICGVSLDVDRDPDSPGAQDGEAGIPWPRIRDTSWSVKWLYIL